MRNGNLALILLVLIMTAGQGLAQNQVVSPLDAITPAGLVLTGALPVKPAEEDIYQSPAPVALLAGISPEKLTTETVILFRVSGAPGSETAVSLCIYDPADCEVAVLVDDLLEPDSYQVRWDGRDGNDRQVPNGLYFTRLAVAGQVITQKITVAR